MLLSLEGFLPYRLSVTASLVSDVIATAYRARYGLKTPEWRVVAAVGEAGELTQQSVCGRISMDKVAVHRAASALRRRGLLCRTVHPIDRRSHHLALTAAGRALYDDVAPRALELERRLLACLAPAETDRFMAMLDAVDAAARDVLDGTTRGG